MSLRAGANHPTHLPFIKRPPKPLLLGYQGGDADDETTRRRGALDITTHFIRVAFRRVVPVQRQRVNTLPRAGACSGDRLNTLPGVHRITPSSVKADEGAMCFVVLWIVHILYVIRALRGGTLPYPVQYTYGLTVQPRCAPPRGARSAASARAHRADTVRPFSSLLP